MKTNIIQSAFVILLMLAVFPGILNSQNMILAGQTEGEDIHYTDYEPDSLVKLNDYPYCFDLDIDLDGENDLGFWIVIDFMPPYWENFRAEVRIYNDQVEIIHLGLPAHVKNLSQGDTINFDQVWTGDSISSSALRGWVHYYNQPGAKGEFYGEFGTGYLGFKFSKNWETYYGWIEVSAYISPSAGGSYIRAMRSAFYSQTVSIENIERTSNKLTIFPNPCQDKFTIQIPEMLGQICRFHISDINGRKIKDGIITGQLGNIDVSDLNPGIYFVEVRNEVNTIQREKLIVL
jgi:hypothetical protein